jgi:phytoene dehydrogenase-like protein
MFPAEASGITAFFAEISAVCRDLYATLDDSGVPISNRPAEAMLAWSARYPDAARWIHSPYAEMLSTFFSSGRLKRLFTTIAEYVTDQPERLTVGDMAPLFSYYFEGGFYPAGGSQKLANVLRAVIEKNGSKVRLRTPVSQILVEDGGVAGVLTAAGTQHRAQLVISNADVATTLSDLVGRFPLPSRYSQRMRGLQRGPSAILVSLGLDFVPDLPARVFVNVENLHFGIGNPSVIDPSLAPPGCAALTLLCLLGEEEATPWFSMDRKTYHRSKEAFTDRLIASAETVISGLSRGILFSQTAAPPTFRRYTLARNGCIYGAARGQWCPTVKSPVPGLLLVGAGCQTGPGVEAAVISGMACANLISAQKPVARID